MKALTLLTALLLATPLAAETITNPDEIAVFFPRLESEGNLGKNVATVLSLQLAQTGRRKPWPKNPENHDFGIATMVWSENPLAAPTHAAAEEEAAAFELLAQIVIWGHTQHYAGEVIADVNITLPRYALPPPGNCRAQSALGFRCDYRRANFETWQVGKDDLNLSVGPPRRRFGVSAIRLRSEIVDEFRDIEGLPIRAGLRDGAIIGRTGTDVRFLEFNPGLPGAPTKLRSRGVTGYVSLPELSVSASEFSDIVGGILQTFRGDWESAEASFARVIENPATRAPLRVRPETLCRITEFSEHESNGRELDEGERVAVEVLPVLGQSAAAVEPGDGAFDHPTPGLDDEALHPIGSLDDLGLEIGQDAGQGAAERPAPDRRCRRTISRERETDRTRSPAARDRRRDPERWRR